MTTGLREKNSERRRQMILEGAIAIIAKEGLDALSMRILSTKVGLSVTTLYNLYGDRDSIVKAVLYRVLDEMGKAISEDEPAVDPVEECLRVMKCITDYFIKRRVIITHIARGVSARTGPFTGDHVDTKARSMKLLAPSFAKVIETGPLKGRLATETLTSIVFTNLESEAEEWADGLLSDKQFEQKIQLVTLLAIHAAVPRKMDSSVKNKICLLESHI